MKLDTVDPRKNTGQRDDLPFALPSWRPSVLRFCVSVVNLLLTPGETESG